jgi:prepilin-type N-terminal cleavage/methylation domain-containing protein
MTTRRRSGYALIELLVVLTVTAVMLTLCAGMIHLLLKLDRTGRTAAEESADLARLARDFRADVHASLDIRAEAQPSTPSKPTEVSKNWATLTLDGGRTVEYQSRPRDILRTVRDGEKVCHFETYQRPARTTVKFWMDGAGPRSTAILMIDRPTDGRDDSFYRDYWIEAEIGKDHRLNPRPK